MSEELRRRIIGRIADRGPIPFDEYMELALYDPDDGFFAAHPVGRGGHFVTSPHVSPAFAMVLAEHVREVFMHLGEPDDFLTVELGAGDGTLAAQLRDAGIPGRYVGVDRSAGARAGLAARGFDARAGMDEIEPFTGCVVANELIDNLPFAIARGTEDGMVELFVDARGDVLVFVERPLRDAVARDAAVVPPGEDRPAWPSLPSVMHTLAERLGRGSALFIDYGFVPGEPVEPIRGYRRHRVEHDLLADPGASDLTAPVDFAAVADAARAVGFEVHGPVTQRDALLSLGFHQVRDGLRARQRDQEAAGDHRGALMTFSARNEAAMLVEPGGLGGLRVIALTTPGMPAPRATNAR